MSLNASYEKLDSNIRKAKFILQNNRTYTLEFDHNIQIKDLKILLQKIAHLNINKIRIFSNGEEYTEYNEELYCKLFPSQSLVIFKIEYRKDEDIFKEREPPFQMNCKDHNNKGLLYYCFTCNKCICSDCFTRGNHKNHSIQDKALYLLPSATLVDKIFENFSKNPYDDYTIDVDLSNIKFIVNNKFKELFKMIGNIHE